MAEVTEAEIRRLRRLVAETGEDSTYTDEELTEYLKQAETNNYGSASVTDCSTPGCVHIVIRGL